MAKIDREIMILEKMVKKSDFVAARRIIELNLEKFKSPAIRQHLSIDTVTLINSVILFNEEDSKDVFSRETQLIIQYINKLAYQGSFPTLKRYCFLQSALLSNPKVYALLSSEAKILIPQP